MLKTLKTIIVDDEPLARQELRKLLSPYQHIEISGEAGNAEDAANLIRELNPDLVFLDIDLGVKTGFDLLESLDIDFEVIFVTAYDAHAIRAFEINALDYLLKPVHPKRLENAIERFGQSNPLQNKKMVGAADKIMVRRNLRQIFVSVDKISIIEANGDYTKIYVDDEYTGMVHQTLKSWEIMLPSGLFQRIHRSYIINISVFNQIIKTPGDTYEIHYKDFHLPVSRKYLKTIREKFRIDS
jgi:two-component system LytT family response regulator